MSNTEIDNKELDKIWDIFYNNIQTNSINNEYEYKNKNNCSKCNSHVQTYETICKYCGLVLETTPELSNYLFNTSVEISTPTYSLGNNRLLKLQEWMTWSNDEKTEYKLTKYTKEFCINLNIADHLINDICNFISQIMKAIKNNYDGPKRSRVKNGIIIMCIYYVSKGTNNPYSYIELSKRINLNMKYISKADKLIMELFNSKKLHLPKHITNNFFKIENPIDYVIKIINKYKLDINKSILNQIEELINICEDNDILLDHTPASIGVSCFYYILTINNIDINIKIFAELYDLSIVTIIKTFNKLKQYKDNFEKMGIKTLIQN
jgi:transcription initiation factor TFIIIB Brf1 subunit/transcription initiation factor TFIIB